MHDATSYEAKNRKWDENFAEAEAALEGLTHIPPLFWAMFSEVGLGWEAR